MCVFIFLCAWLTLILMRELGTPLLGLLVSFVMVIPFIPSILATEERVDPPPPPPPLPPLPPAPTSKVKNSTL